MSIIGAFRDRGKVLSPTTANNGPWPVPSTYAAGSEIRCRARQTGAHEVAEHGEIKVTDWEIRVPAGTSIAHQSGFQVTRYRNTAASINLLVVGEPEITMGQIVFRAKTDPSIVVA